MQAIGRRLGRAGGCNGRFIEVPDLHRSARGKEALHGRQTDAARAAGNDGRAAGKIDIVHMRLSLTS